MIGRNGTTLFGVGAFVTVLNTWSGGTPVAGGDCIGGAYKAAKVLALRFFVVVVLDVEALVESDVVLVVLLFIVLLVLVVEFLALHLFLWSS